MFMKKFLSIAIIIAVLSLAGCAKDNSVSEIKNDEKNNNVEQEQEMVNSFFENDDVVVRLNILEEMHDYSEFSGESLYTQTSYLYNFEYGKVNLSEENGKIVLEVSCDSKIKFCNVNNKILSIVFETPTYPGTEYNVLNVDITSRKILSTKEFVQITDKSIDELKSIMENVEYELIKEISKEYSGENMSSEDFSLYASEEYFKENFDFDKIEFYYNELGHLSANFQTYFGITGSGPINYLYDLETKVVTDKISEI